MADARLIARYRPTVSRYKKIDINNNVLSIDSSVHLTKIKAFETMTIVAIAVEHLFCKTGRRYFTKKLIRGKEPSHHFQLPEDICRIAKVM